MGILYFIILISPVCVYPAYVNKVFSIKNGWTFMSKFAFLHDDGVIKFHLTFFDETVNPDIFILTIDGDIWNNVYLPNKQSNCSAMKTLLNRYSPHSFNLIEHGNPMHVNKTIRFQIEQLKYSAPAGNFTFIVVFNCAGAQTFNMVAQIYMENTEIENIFRHQISADHTYIMECSIIFSYIYACMAIIGYCYRKALKRQDRSLIIQNLLHLVILIKFFVFFEQLVIMVIYGYRGTFGVSNFLLTDFLANLSQLLFIIFLLLLGFGFSIICGKLNAINYIILISFGLIYFSAILAATVLNFINYSDDQLTTTYSYIPIYLTVGLQIFIMATFASSTSIIIYKYRSRRKFYTFFFGISLFWFLTTIIATSAAPFLPLLVQFRFAVICKSCIDVLVQLVYLTITYPNLFSNIIIYTTPANVLAGITFREALSTKNYDNYELDSANPNFFNLSEFHVES